MCIAAIIGRMGTAVKRRQTQAGLVTGCSGSATP
jgi:hypothetical protein